MSGTVQLLGNWRYVRLDALADIEQTKRDLTLVDPAFVKAEQMGFFHPEDADPAIRLFRLPDEEGMLVPRHYRPTLRPGVLSMTQRTYGVNLKYAFKAVSQPRDDVQVAAIDWLARPEDGRLMLRAAAGKTVVSLLAAARVGIGPILVVVHERATLEQWINRIVTHTDVPRHAIGIIQGKTATFADAPISVAMMQTLALHSEESWKKLQAYLHGGLVIYDELDVFPARKMQNALSLFAATRWGLTATHRTDGLQPVLNMHLGQREHYIGGYDVQPIVVSLKIRLTPKDYLTRYRQLTNLITHLEVEHPEYRAVLWQTCLDSVKKGRKTLLLLQRTEAIESFGRMGLDAGLSVGIIHGQVGQKERLEVLASRQLIIANRKIAGRALDQPDIATIISGPTSNPSFAEQIAGRALRQCADKERPVVIVVYPDIGSGNTGEAMGLLRGMTDKHIRTLRRIGLTDVRLVEKAA